MTRTRQITVIWIAAAVLAAAGIVLIVLTWPGTSTPSTTASPSSSTATSSPSTDSSTATTAPSTSTAAAPSSADQSVSIYDSPNITDAQLQQYLEESARHLVERPLHDELTAIAGQVLTADVTGIGREQWPNYFDGQPATEAWSAPHVRAAIAEWTHEPVAVDVTLVWSATDPLGVVHAEQSSTITLASTSNGWIPVAG